MTQIQKKFITPEELRLDSYRLAAQVLKSGFTPDTMIALWRGGATPGKCVHEFLKYKGLTVDHVAIRTSKYTGIDEADSKVQVHSLGYLSNKLNKESKVLIIDDVYDTGDTITAVLEALRNKLGENCPDDIRIGTIHYKPKRNRSNRVHNYYVRETDEWLVYPHELEGLSLEEIEQHYSQEVVELILNV